MSYYVRLSKWLLTGLLVLGAGPSEAITEFRGFARSKSALYKGPGESYGKFDDAVLQEKEEVHILGTSIGQNWTQVLTDGGIEAWVPASRLDVRRLLPGEYDRFLLLLDKKRRITNRFIANIGGVYRNKPDGLGLGLHFVYNFTPNGFATLKADQMELATGFYYHLASDGGGLIREALFEIPLQVNWLFRFGKSGDFMLGPTLGASFFSKAYELDRDSKFSVLGGVHGRYYFGEYTGLFWELDAVGYEFNYLKLLAGFSARF